MKRCVIVGGADIEDHEYVRSRLREDDFFVFCDCGLRHRERLNAEPGLIVGDFDSHPKPDTDTETIVLPCEKDDTDTFFAVKEALKRGFEDFLLLGVIGGRLDHTIGNLSILLYLDSLGKRGLAIDDHSEMRIVSGAPVSVDGGCSFFSLLNITGDAEGITVENAEYPLKNGMISCEYQYGISNRVLPGKSAKVSLRKGRLLLVTVRRG